MTDGQNIIFENYRQFVENANFSIVIFRFENNAVKIVMASRGFLSMKAPHMDRESAIAFSEQNFFTNIDPDDEEEFKKALTQFVQDPKKCLDFLFHVRIYDEDEYSFVQVKGYHFVDEEGRDSICLYYDDVFKSMKDHNANVNGNEKTLFRILTKTYGAYCIVDAKTHEIYFINEEMKKLCVPEDQYEGMTFEKSLLGPDSQYVYDLESIINETDAIFPRSQEAGDLMLNVYPLTWRGKPSYEIRVHRFDYKYYDLLTNMRSVTFFRERGPQVVEKLLEKNFVPTLVYMDLRNMKIYNRTYGFEAGDELLIETGKIITKIFYKEAVFKFPNDHFVAITTAEGLEDKIEAVQEKLRNLGKGLTVEIRAGIHCIDPKVDIMSECDKAQIACDSIKNERNRMIKVYDSSLIEKKDVYEYVIKAIDDAIKNEWIEVYYQPVVRTLTTQLCSFEALSRWNDPHFGFLNPGYFIDALEDTHQIHKLDCFMIRKICEQLRERIDQGLPVVPVSFNLSRLDFLACNILKIVNDTVTEYGISRDLIHVEITESIVATNRYIRDEVEKFRQVGYEVWMDDFGSGYSSLNLLKDYDFDELKCDMLFLRSFTERSKEIMKSIIQMAKKLSIQTLAEGVESKEQYEFLREIGCEKVQGYYFGKPAPLDVCIKNIQKMNIGFEERALEPYYKAAGAIDVTSDEPLAIFENEDGYNKYLYLNQKFRDALADLNIHSIEESEQIINNSSHALFQSYHSYFDQPKETWDEIRRVATNNDHLMINTIQKIAEHGENYIFVMKVLQTGMMDVNDYNSRIHSLLSELIFLYDFIQVINFDQDRVEVYLEDGMMVPSNKKKMTIGEFREAYVNKWLHPKERKRYLEFTDEKTLFERIKHSQKNNVSERFLTYNSKTHRYEWKLYTELLLPHNGKRVFMELIKTTILEEGSFH